MQNGLYVALSAQVRSQRRLDTIAANVANMNTPGYRADGVTFEAASRQGGRQPPHLRHPGSTTLSRARVGPLIRPAIRSTSPFRATAGSRSTDAARPSTPATDACRLSENGALQNVNGATVLDAGGAPIQLDRPAAPPSISRRRHDHPERPADRRDRPLPARRRREADARRQFRLHLRQAGNGRARLHPQRRSSRALSRAPTSTRSKK